MADELATCGHPEVWRGLYRRVGGLRHSKTVKLDSPGQIGKLK